MGTKYRQLSYHDRIVIDKMLGQRCSKRQIAAHLQVHPSTIYRELKRNSRHPKRDIYNQKEKVYDCYYAQKSYLKRRQCPSKLERNHDLRQWVHQRLRAGWSPWQIEWYFKSSRCNATLSSISHESIYRYIYSHWKIRHEFVPHLRRRHKSRVKLSARKKRYPSCLMIKHRPDRVNMRDVFGHWECDLMMFKQGIKQNLITLVERKTRFTIAIKNENKQTAPTIMAIIKRLTPLKPFIHSITFDQGSKFYKYQWVIDCLEAEVYFCDAGSPYQKGSIENRNGVIRTVFPRDFDIPSTSQATLDKMVTAMNDRPMRCLQYESPMTLFEKAITHEFND